ncbi:MAG: hypothetical protein CM1200mP1_13390 [Candidatus Neomarinimicrobiota bacterium]|nr:MAG: hypothetical protein CM1200mP1_13390 [Candidatus Neomarinimicrobiota bacterium]
MYSDIDEQVILERDCEGTLFPLVIKLLLKKVRKVISLKL